MSLKSEIEKFLNNEFNDAGQFHVQPPENRVYYRNGKPEKVETVIVTSPYPPHEEHRKDDPTKKIAQSLYKKFGSGGSKHPRRLFNVRFSPAH